MPVSRLGLVGRWPSIPRSSPRFSSLLSVLLGAMSPWAARSTRRCENVLGAADTRALRQSLVQSLPPQELEHALRADGLHPGEPQARAGGRLRIVYRPARDQHDGKVTCPRVHTPMGCVVAARDEGDEDAPDALTIDFVRARGDGWRLGERLGLAARTRVSDAMERRTGR